ncbi:MAG: Fe-S cluster assembly protein SufD [Gammaproteobacteria bacterium]|nr:Fe-S cluster assembly protein SufD [Gammaproteobacteria bacterium]
MSVELIGNAARRVSTAAVAWLEPARQAALLTLRESGLPTTASEEWRYTDLGPAIARLAPAGELRPALDVAATAWPDLLLETGWPVCLIVDGSLQSGADSRVRQFSAVQEQDRAFLAGAVADSRSQPSALADLNAALLGDGTFVDLPAGVTDAAPLYLACATSTAAATASRIVIRCGRQRRATLLLHFLSASACASSTVVDIHCEAGAELSLVVLQDQSDDAIHLGCERVSVAAGASLDMVMLDAGAGLARNDLLVTLADAGARLRLASLMVGDGARHVDQYCRIEHRGTSTSSQVTVRGIADEGSRLVFNGKVIVHPGAKGADAAMRNQNLLLSAAAEVDTRPELEINENEVRCSHGATTGQLDQNALFYLRSRGIADTAARRMLLGAFAREILARLPAGLSASGLLAGIGRHRDLWRDWAGAS